MRESMPVNCTLVTFFAVFACKKNQVIFFAQMKVGIGHPRVSRFLLSGSHRVSLFFLDVRIYFFKRTDEVIQNGSFSAGIQWTQSAVKHELQCESQLESEPDSVVTTGYHEDVRSACLPEAVLHLWKVHDHCTSLVACSNQSTQPETRCVTLYRTFSCDADRARRE